VLGTPAVTTSNAQGTFFLANLPTGTQGVVVRGVGFSPTGAVVELSASTPSEVTIALGSAQLLAPIEAEGKGDPLDRVGFTTRRRIGLGRFFTREDIDKTHPSVVTDIFKRTPGIRLTVDRAGNQILQSTHRGAGEPDECVVTVVDGTRLQPPSQGRMVSYLNGMVQPEQIVAMELYQAFQVPGEFTFPAERCMTIVIWTQATVPGPNPDDERGAAPLP